MPQQPAGWTLVQPAAAAPAAEPTGWTPVAVAEPTATKPAAPDPSSWAQNFGRAALGNFASSVHPEVVDAVGNGVIGILKGMGHTAEGLGKLVHLIPGVTTATDAAFGKGSTDAGFKAADQATTPEGTAQKVGSAVEQAAEFLVPAGAAERGATAVATKLAPSFTNAPRIVQTAARVAPRMATEAASAASVSAAQDGNPVAAGVIGAAGPVAGAALESATGALKGSATKQVEQFFGATKERYKAMAQRLTPQMLARGIRGSREGVMAQAAAAAEEAGQAVDTALQQFGSRQVGTADVSNALEKAKDAFRVTNAAGKVVEVEPRAIAQLSKLRATIDALGPDATVEQMVAVRRAWDTVVSQAGGFAHRAPGAVGMPLKDTTEAWAKREGAGAIRKLLDRDVPELSAVNKEYSFWKGVEDTLTQTTQRTGPQGPGLAQQIAGAAGAAAGASHGIGGAVALQKLGKLANATFSSPRWRLASAQAKDALADAIIGGKASDISSALSRILAGASSQAAATGGQP